ncbi:CRISPR system precrRNA processing endoribonuclease RAMP protein Cas6 [Nocardiopsis dassonvillei]|uniref:CRISPR system precrRNA processing endoribonuclease RAMP protein Cas6 n=1 Tax=Nocardiopsis dassonvillei TaxID=2014 RepID=UPI00366D990E
MAPPALQAKVEFITSAYVNRAGRQLLLPEPELLLAGLARRWVVFSPQPLSSPAMTKMLDTVHLARHDICIQPMDSGRHHRTGFVGSALFGLFTQASRAAQRAFTTRWSFATFAGVGAQTNPYLGHFRVHLHEQSARLRLEHSQDSVREKNTHPTITTLTGQVRYRPRNGSK